MRERGGTNRNEKETSKMDSGSGFAFDFVNRKKIGAARAD